jgi:hypothetical protein
MAMGKIVVCNTEAATGIPITDKKNVFLANSSAAFIEVINSCFENLKEQNQIGKNARILIEEHFSSKKKGKELELFLKSI